MIKKANKKMENINPELLLAIDSKDVSTEGSLYIGYNREDNSWNLIIRYSGDIDDLVEQYMNRCIYLLGGYAIINIFENNIESLVADSRILYIDKSHYFSYGETYNSFEKYSACVSDYVRASYNLNGEGVLVGIMDSGVDIRNSQFSTDGKTRVVAYWDQNEVYDYNSPNRYEIGRIYNRDELLVEEVQNEIAESLYSTHGTEVCSVVAGNSTGIATGSPIVVVEQASDRNIPDTISIMMGLDFLVRYAINVKMPLVINLSYGNNYGAHDGSSTLEEFIDEISQLAKVSIVTGTGNDGAKSIHTNGLLGNVSFEDLDIVVEEGVNNFGLQIWKNYADLYDVIVYSPSFEAVLYLTEGQISSGSWLSRVSLYGIYQAPTPSTVRQLIYIFFQSNTFISPGKWKVRLYPKKIISGSYDAYLPGESFITGKVYFDKATLYSTLTIPATGKRIISVAAYNQITGGLAAFSGRGFTTNDSIKPDIAAPGVGITTSLGMDVFSTADGTSISAAFVSGCSSLLMQWGIVNGNDPFMYGERLKAQLIRGAKELDNVDIYPNRYIGWGILCFENSIMGLFV